MSNVGDKRVAEIVAEICEEVHNIARGIVAARPELSAREAIAMAADVAGVLRKGGGER